MFLIKPYNLLGSSQRMTKMIEIDCSIINSPENQLVLRGFLSYLFYDLGGWKTLRGTYPPTRYSTSYAVVSWLSVIFPHRSMNRGIRPLACALEGERHLLSPLCQPSFRFTRFFPAGSDWRASHPVVAWDPGSYR